MAVSPAELGVPRRITQMEERLPAVANAAQTMEMAWKIAGVPEDDIIRMRENLLKRATDPNVRTDRVQPTVDIADTLAPHLPVLEYQVKNREIAFKQPDTSTRESIPAETSPKKSSFDQQIGEQTIVTQEMLQSQASTSKKNEEAPQVAANHWRNEKNKLGGRAKGNKGPGRYSAKSF